MNHPWDLGNYFTVGNGIDQWHSGDTETSEFNSSFRSFDTLSNFSDTDSYSDISKVSSGQQFQSTSLGTSDFSTQTFENNDNNSNFSPQSLTNNFFAYGVSSLIRDYNQYSTSNSLNMANMGLGPLGHAFDANFYANRDADFSTFTRNLESSAVTLGSAFGPEGTIAGMGVAGLIELGSSYFQPSHNETMTNTGNLSNGNAGISSATSDSVQETSQDNGSTADN